MIASSHYIFFLINYYFLSEMDLICLNFGFLFFIV